MSSNNVNLGCLYVAICQQEFDKVWELILSKEWSFQEVEKASSFIEEILKSGSSSSSVQDVAEILFSGLLSSSGCIVDNNHMHQLAYDYAVRDNLYLLLEERNFSEMCTYLDSIEGKTKYSMNDVFSKILMHRKNKNEVNCVGVKLLKGNFVFDSLNAIGESLLHVSAKNGFSELTSLLLNKNIDIECKDSWGRTPLHFGVSSESISVVSVLLDAGADPFANDEFGETPLDFASNNENASILKLLLENESNFFLKRRNYSELDL